MKDLLILLPFILVPAVALAFVRAPVRRLAGVIGLGAGLVLELLVGGGADNFAASFGFMGFALAIAALLGEALAFLAFLLRRRGGRTAGEGG